MQKKASFWRWLLLGCLLTTILVGSALPAQAAFDHRQSALWAGPTNTTCQTLPFSQTWTNTGLITTDEDWSAVPGVMGYRGDDLTTNTGTDPQTLLMDGTTVIDVNANQTNPDTFATGGVTEFEIADPVVALAGSGTADAPFALICINTTGLQNITISYNLRDIDGSTDNAAQQVALHYRVGASGNFTNLPAGYVADATTGPSLATLVTPVSVVLPAAADNQAQVQVRVMTTNAVGNDEWVGIDDISITGTSIDDTPPTVASTIPSSGATGVATTATITVNFSEPVTVLSGWYAISCTSSGAHTASVSGGPQNYILTPSPVFTLSEICTVTIDHTKVHDLDVPLDYMAANYQWNFTIAVPACTSNLFISEYIEGSSYNKAIEIVNMTGSTVNLSTGGYKLLIYANGASDPLPTINLTGSVAHGDVYVVCHGSANAAILAQCDQIYGFAFNGDDAIALAVGATPTLLDVIGQIGTDPGTDWNAGGNLSTAEHTLTRMTYIQAGDADGSDDFVPELNLEWFGFAQDTFSNLGSHTIQCSEPGPRITATSPIHKATGVNANANLTITFSEPVNVTGEWFTINCNPSGTHTAAVSGGPTTFTLNPDVNFTTGDICTVSINKDLVTDQDTNDPPDTLEANQSWKFFTTGACSTIPLIQGNGYASECLGPVTNIEGCITGIAADGFYFQDLSGDGNAATSDGLFVYRGSTWTNPSGWIPGDRVRVTTGEIIEYYNTTEFQSGNSVTRLGSCTLPTPVTISPITDPFADPMSLYEQYEGMRVQMTFNGFVVGATKRFDSRFANGDPEIAFVDSSSSIYGQRVFYNDYPGYQGINYLSGGLDRNLPDVDFGDTIAATNATGVLGYQFDKYTLLVDSSTAYTVVDDPNDVLNPIPIGNEEFAICTFNAENMFDHINDGDGDVGDWSPANATEYDNMLTKRARAIIDNLKGCTILALEEIEGKEQVWLDLIAKITALGGPTYAYDYYESVDPRDITVGILYLTSRVTLNYSTQRQSCSSINYGVSYTYAQMPRVVFFTCPGSTYPVSSRPPYVANVTVTNSTGGQPLELILIVNHFKSKSGDESENAVRRLAEANWVLTLMSPGEYYDDPTNGSVNIVTLGDFNDYLDSEPVNVFNTTVGGNLLANLYLKHVPDNDEYSYNFNGESEILDHFIATFELNSYYLHGRPVHINSDFPDLLTITSSDNCPGGICTFGATPDDLSNGLRSSDHDPIFARFGFPLTNDFSDLETSYGLARHVAAHTLWLGPTVTDEASAVLNGDNLSDDGITRPTPWQDGANGGSVSVSVSGAGPGCLHAWIDWNGDGTFDEGTEHIINAGVGGTTTYTFDVPTGSFPGSGANLLFPARFRLYATCPAASETAPYGTSANGEVEDYIFGFFPTAITLEHFSVSQRTTPWAWALLPAILVSAGGLLWLRRRSK